MGDLSSYIACCTAYRASLVRCLVLLLTPTLRRAPCSATTATAEACEHDTSLTWLLIGVFVMIAACWAAVHGTKGDHY